MLQSISKTNLKHTMILQKATTTTNTNHFQDRRPRRQRSSSSSSSSRFSPLTLLLLVFSILVVLVSSSSSSSLSSNNNNNNNELQEDENDQKQRILQSSNPTVKGEAYECDELFQKIVDVTPRPLGYEIRICVWPDLSNRKRDVVVRSIDTWTFYKEFGQVAQSVVEKKPFKEDPNSIVLCTPGQLICSLKTRLKNDFFYGDKPTNITGTGQISFEFDADAFADQSSGGAGRRNRRRVVVQQQVEFNVLRSSSNQQQQNQRSMIEYAPGGFAGFRDVSVTIPVVGVERPEDDPITIEETEGGWWENAPGWLKALVILGGIITLILLCCLCWLCVWSLRNRIHEEEEERKRKEQEQEYYDDDDDEYNDDNDGVNVEYMQPTYAENDGGYQETAPPGGDDEPTDYDICFDADDHPGTKDMHTIMLNIMQNNPDAIYGPTIYKIVKKQLPDRKFYVVDDETRPDVWREAANKELIDLFRKEWDDLLFQQQ